MRARTGFAVLLSWSVLAALVLGLKLIRIAAYPFAARISVMNAAALLGSELSFALASGASGVTIDDAVGLRPVEERPEARRQRGGREPAPGGRHRAPGGQQAAERTPDDVARREPAEPCDDRCEVWRLGLDLERRKRLEGEVDVLSEA